MIMANTVVKTFTNKEDAVRAMVLLKQFSDLVGNDDLKDICLDEEDAENGNFFVLAEVRK